MMVYRSIVYSGRNLYKYNIILLLLYGRRRRAVTEDNRKAPAVIFPCTYIDLINLAYNIIIIFVYYRCGICVYTV